MQTTTFTYSASQKRKLGWLFLVIAVISIVVAVYMWLWANPILLSVLVAAVLLALLGLFLFFKLQFTASKAGLGALIISDEGIKAITTPVAKAAGLILWEDIEEITLSPTVIELKIKKLNKYASRMGNFFVRDSFLKALKGWIRIPYMETNATYLVLKHLLENQSDEITIEN